MYEYKSLNKTVYISTMYSGIMVLSSLFSPTIVLAFNAVYVVWLFNKIRRYFMTRETIFLCSILFIPTSTISILGTSTAQFSFSLFHLFVIILFFCIIINRYVNKEYLLLVVLFFSYGVFQSFIAPDWFDAAKQLLTILLFLFSFIIGSFFKKNSTYGFASMAQKLYLFGTISVGIQILVQKSVISITGKIIGHYATMGGSRIAYAGLMGDFSFATLFLASGCMLLLVRYLEYHNIGLLPFIIGELFLAYCSLVVTSRTGIVALGIVVVLYVCKNWNKFGWKFAIMIIGMIAVMPLALNILLASRSGQNLFDSSGRIENYKIAIQLFCRNPLLGVGLGLKHLLNDYGILVPHNFFIQYLLQIGFLGTIIMLLFYLIYLINDFDWKNPMRWIFWLIVIGSMFIPDIFSSRFYYAIIVICMFPSFKLMDEE